MERFDKVMLNYSGGYDSLTAAIVLAGKAKAIHLVTFKVLTGIFTGLSAKNLKKLRKDFPDVEFVHKVVDIRDVQEKMLSGFAENCMKYRDKWASLGLWCCTCQLSMRAASIIYCLENGITWCADGSTKSEYHHASHKVEFINKIRELYSEYGLRFFNPVYDFERDPRDFLKRKGYTVGIEVFSVKKIQPFCFFTFFSLVRQMASPDATPEKVVAEYVGSMIPVMRKTVDEDLEEKGIDKSSIKKTDLTEEDFIRYSPPKQMKISRHKWSALVLWIVVSPFYFLFDLTVCILYHKGKTPRERR